ncbi:MAG: putative zinc-binding metallopeptidase, partial [Eubacterium sp.]|nr:putative zinc-binding metallopeptidase [Eubacterium sp.]
IEYNANTLDVNLLLTELSECLELFPDNFIKEIYEDFSDAINVYIVGNISEANAFAIASEVTFSIRGFSKNVVFHEFMHMICNRIIDYYEKQNENMYELWNRFNKEDFLYNEDYSELDSDHFVSIYAMTDENEDMAETFQYLYETAEYDEFPENLNNEQVYKKAEFICESIRKAFPSADTENKNYWEKHIELKK